MSEPEESIRLKVGHHFATFSVWALYWDQFYGTASATFSKTQWVRIQKLLEAWQPEIDRLKQANLDVYTEDDF